MATSSCASTALNYIYNIPSYLSSARIASQEQIVKNVQRVAIPAFAIMASYSIQLAEAVTYKDCFENCNKHEDAHPLAKLICYAICAMFCEKDG